MGGTKLVMGGDYVIPRLKREKNLLFSGSDLGFGGSEKSEFLFQKHSRFPFRTITIRLPFSMSSKNFKIRLLTFRAELVGWAEIRKSHASCDKFQASRQEREGSR
jgi:hypothetical protein